MANSVTSTAMKAKYTKKTKDSAYQVYHLETDTNQVLIDTPLATGESFGGGTIEKNTPLQEVLEAIIGVADTGGQASEDLSAHKADYTNPHKVTKDQVGLGNVANKEMDSTPTSGSTNYVTSGGVYDAVDEANTAAVNAQATANNALKIAQGRSSAWVFNGITQLMNGTGVGAYRVGDSVYITASNVSDFWISNIASYAVTGWAASTESEISTAKDGSKVYVKWVNTYVTLVAVETKTDLSSYLTSSSAANTYVKKSDMPVFKGDATGTGTYANGITLTLSQTGVEEGTYSAVSVNKAGRVTAGAQMIAFATGMNDTSLDTLAVGGIAVIENS